MKPEGEETGMFSLFPKTSKINKDNKRFRTIERDESANAYSGKVKNLSKQKLLLNNLNNSTSSKPSRARFNTSSIDRDRSKQGSASQDFKLISKGINFEVKPFNPMLNQETSKSCLHNNKKTYNHFLNSNLKFNSRATTSDLHRRPKNNVSASAASKLRSRKNFETKTR